VEVEVEILQDLVMVEVEVVQVVRFLVEHSLLRKELHTQ
jgi:hypothetical protein